MLETVTLAQTAKSSSDYLPFRAEVTLPGRVLPLGACDCHFHIFEPTSAEGQ